MRWPGIFDRTRYSPKEGETRPDFLRRLAESGLPQLGYAEALRSPVWELCREVVALRAQVDSLQRDLDELRQGRTER